MQPLLLDELQKRYVVI